MHHLSKTLRLFGICVLFLLAGCGDQYEGDFSYELQPFAFTNQDGDTVTKEDFEGEFVIADVIFTNCETVCPPMTANMVRLQDKLEQENLSVNLVSFSVDPENDTKEKLKTYAKERGGEFDNWDLLTGYSFKEVKELSIKSFKAPLEKLPDSNQVMHTTNFYLITPEGNAIKKYDGTKAANMDKIVADVKEMM